VHNTHKDVEWPHPLLWSTAKIVGIDREKESALYGEDLHKNHS